MRMPLVRRATTAGAASRAERTTPSVGWSLPLLVGLMDTAWITPYALLLGTIWRSAGWSLLAPIAILVLLTGAQVGTRRLLVTTKSRYLPLLLIAVGVIV